jgi:hypothetical protein
MLIYVSTTPKNYSIVHYSRLVQPRTGPIFWILISRLWLGLGLVYDFFLRTQIDKTNVTQESVRHSTKVRQNRIFGVRQNEFFIFFSSDTESQSHAALKNTKIPKTVEFLSPILINFHKTRKLIKNSEIKISVVTDFSGFP